MATIWKGSDVSVAIDARTREAADQLKRRGVQPTLAIVRVGESGDDVTYERGAVKRAESVGVRIVKYALPQQVAERDLIRRVRLLSRSRGVHGILLLRPLPDGIDEERVFSAIAPEKDVDGVTAGSLAGVFAQTGLGFPPCTAEACMEILDYYGVDPAGKRAVVVGRSLVVGRPLSMLLLGRNATVTVCHTKTPDLPAVTRGADILIAAAGKPGLICGEHVSPGQVVLDVGINFTADGKLAGDVRFDEVMPVVSAITPVPGGVGTVTTSVLVWHVVTAAVRAHRG